MRGEPLVACDDFLAGQEWEQIGPHIQLRSVFHQPLHSHDSLFQMPGDVCGLGCEAEGAELKVVGQKRTP